MILSRAQEKDMITVVAHCTIKKEFIDAFLNVSKPYIEANRKEAGNISFDLYEDPSSPEKYTFIEVWKDQNAIDEYKASAQFHRFGTAAGPLFEGDLDLRFYQKVNT